MLKNAFCQDKNLLIARVRSRGNYSDSKLEYIEQDSNLYNAYVMIKILLRKKDDEYVSRYDEHQGMTSLDPVSKNRVTDEVDFFQI